MGSALSLCQSDQQLLFLACERGNVELVRRLLSKRGTHAPKVNAKEKRSGSTALAIAAGAGHAGVVRLLIERSAALELATDTGFTPLCLAVRGNHDKAAVILVNSSGRLNAGLEAADLAYGCTPLLWSVQSASPSLVRFLVERGADLEARSRFGFTPLVYAAQCGQGGPGGTNASLEKTKILLAAGADPRVKDLRGATAAQHARQKNNRSVAELLEAAIDDPEGVGQQCAREIGYSLPTRAAPAQGSASVPPPPLPSPVSSVSGPGEPSPAGTPTLAPAAPAPAPVAALPKDSAFDDGGVTMTGDNPMGGVHVTSMPPAIRAAGR